MRKGKENREDRKWLISRRGFLISMGTVGAGLALGVPLGLPLMRRRMATADEASFLNEGDLDPLAWLEVSADNTFKLYVTKAEMGQGIHTALGQVAAEELEIPVEMLSVVHATTNQSDGKYSGTSGSMSIRTLYTPLRKAAAAMREMLKTEAALFFKSPASDLAVENGFFMIGGDPDKRVSYGKIAARRNNWVIPEEEIPLKSADSFSLIGTSLPRKDIPSKVNGEAVFGFDARIEGMLYGAVLRPPTIGARLISINTGAAEGMPGVAAVVAAGDFAGVAADSREQARAACDAIVAEWETEHLWQQEEIEELLKFDGPGGVVLQKEGNAKIDGDTPRLVKAEYSTGIGAHASLETQAALAEVAVDGVRVWTTTQYEYSVRTRVAKELGLEEETVEVVPMFVGGGFGRKSSSPSGGGAAVEAALLSKAAGKPVHVGWTREEEMRCGFFRPPTRHKLSAVLNDRGGIETMENLQASGEGLANFLPEFVSRMIGYDFGAARGTMIPYAIPNRLVKVWKHEMPLPTGPWRGVGLLPNTFPRECFIDDLAAAAGADPVIFRLRHCGEDGQGRRIRRVIEVAADRSGWGTALPAGRQRGIAFCIDAGSYIAQAAEISLNTGTGVIRVHKVTAVIDCGKIINPDGAVAQVEGATVMGMSAALLEEVTVSDGRIDAENFYNYPLLQMADSPNIVTVLLESPDGVPQGVGEPGVGPIGPAIANAFFALTGKHLRRLPMTRERVLEVLRS
jgi:isoquinoline 1-oxidoreductase subunit beta